MFFQILFLESTFFYCFKSILVWYCFFPVLPVLTTVLNLEPTAYFASMLFTPSSRLLDH